MTRQHELVEVNDIQDIFISRTRDRAGFKCLVESIKNIGLIVPVTLHKKGTKYELIKGQGRFEAHKALGLKKIKAYVIEEDIQEEEKIGNWLVENIVRQHLSPFDKARMIYYEYQKCGDLNKIAGFFGITESKIKDAVSFIEKASPVVLKKVESKEISFTQAKKTVAWVKQKGTQESVAEILSTENLDGKSGDVIIKRAADLERKKKSHHDDDVKVSVGDLRRDIRFLREEVQHKKDFLSTYENLWELGVNAINNLGKDRRFMNLLEQHKIGLLKEEV